jgi:hypothetical protein
MRAASVHRLRCVRKRKERRALLRTLEALFEAVLKV